MTMEGADTGSRLNALLAGAGLPLLEAALSKRFEDYYSLLIRWNARINLTAIRTEEGILSRHFVESIACGNALPGGIVSLLDFGSGAGFPGIPIALCRPEMAVMLAESHGRKAAFLQEAVRVLGISARVHSGRAETLAERFDCVVMRAVDRMPQAVEAAGRLVAPGGLLALMTTRAELGGLQATAGGAEFSWNRVVQLPGSEDRLVALGERVVSLQAL
jgi:16S rRNA (guanine527-N7)-methyltransferase